VERHAVFIHGAFSHDDHLAGWAELFSQSGFNCHVPCLPAHRPEDRTALSALTLSDYLAALRDTIKWPEPVLIGHSMGGLLAQQLATAIPCRALVCVASAPPWRLRAQGRALPYLLPMIPAILAGRSVVAPERTLQALVLHDLPGIEQRALLPTFSAESGRAYRAMILGLARLPRDRFRGSVLCLSGGQDRIISRSTSDTIARYYGADHEIFERRGHWLIAPSAEHEVAAFVIRWLSARGISTTSTPLRELG
jgi:pimeloyl-ACP methyl ester carboxylesterase